MRRSATAHVLLAAAALLGGAVLLLHSRLAARAPSRGPVRRVVIVTLDTLRADLLPSYGHPRRTAPFLAELARESIQLDAAHAASSHTGPAHASLFTSLYPMQHGLLRNGESLAAGTLTLAAWLRAKGIGGRAFSSVNFLSPLGEGFDGFEGHVGGGPGGALH